MPSRLIRSVFRAAIAVSCVLAMPAVAQDPGRGDLQALRFYLQQENDRAVRAELQRLRIQFPNWSPPEDLSDLAAAAGPQTLDQIYRHIAAEEFESARGLISQTDADNPDWSPPSDLLDFLRVSEAQVDFDAAVAEGQPEAAIGIARTVSDLLSCERINNAWNLAEMHLLQGQTSEAMGVYRAIMSTCTDVELLISTLEKADDISTLTELEALADTARAQASQDAQQLRQVEDRLRAGRQEPARWGNNERAIALGITGTQQPEGAPSVAPASEAALRPAPRPAAVQPPESTARQPTPAPVAQAPGPSGGSLAAARAAAQRGAWSECLALTSGATRIDLVYERAWCAYNADRPMEALDAFRSAAQSGSSATMRRDAAYGWMLALLKMNMTEQAARILAGTALTHTQRLEIESQILDQRGVRAFEQRQFTQAIAFFDAHERLTGQVRRDLMLLKGYALLNSGNRAAARDVFLRLHRQLSTPQTRQALRATE